jgi:pimeloyl-ACP methyl ester carboxylesterase
MRYSLFLFLLLSLNFSCNESPEISIHADDFFNIEENNAVLPIWIRGNTSSGKIILFLQGGPASPAIDFARIDYPGWRKTLEKDFAIVYFDYRGVGNKQGTFDLNTISYDQYMTDIHKILLFLKAKYNNPELYILGHSWGGYLAYHYLINYQSITPVKGFISANGSLTTDYEEIRWQYRKAYLSQVATAFIDAQEDISYWEEVHLWIDATDVIDTDEEKMQWNIYVAKAAVEADDPVATSDYLKVAFFSPYNILSYLATGKDEAVSNKLYTEEKNFHVLNQIDRITLPVLFITGQYDDVAPPEEMQAGYERIGSPDKYFHVINDAGHESFLDKPIEFHKLIDDFINR